MNVKYVVVIATAVIGATVIASCSTSATNQSIPSSGSAAQSASAVPVADHDHADTMFARHMIPHHQQAIQMSDMILAKQEIDRRVVELAKQIKAAQGPEIEEMQGWLRQWGMPPMSAMPGPSGSMMPGMGGMDGMMSPADMQALQNARGVEASKLFLTGMIRHHEGAIAMAQSEIRDGQYPQAVALARSIATSQQQEIDTMKRILESL